MSRKQQTEEWKDKDGDKEEVLVNVGGRYPADTWEEYGLKQLCHFLRKRVPSWWWLMQ